MFYDQGLSFKYAIRPLQYSRVLKNGRIKYYTKNAKCIVFNYSGNEIFYDLNHMKVVEIREIISKLEAAREEGVILKKEIDARIKFFKEKISELKKQNEAEVQCVNSKTLAGVRKIDNTFEKVFVEATKEQMRELNKYRNWAIISGVVLISVFIALVIISGVVNLIRTRTESSRNYFINASNSTFDCNLYEKDGLLRCEDGVIRGEFSNFETVRFEGASDLGYGVFSKKFEGSDLNRFFTNEDTDILKIEKRLIQRGYFSIFNTFLNRTVVTKSIKVEFKLTEKDKELFFKKNQEWREKKLEEERKRLEERVRKEEDAKREAEAILKNDNEKKMCATRGNNYRWESEKCVYHAPVLQNQPTNPPAQSGPTNNNYYSPNSGVTDNITGYCNDGTLVTGRPSARGRANACWGHKGWRDY